nr:MAG TPA: hypothetical protein [Caudoviricetes sp.]
MVAFAATRTPTTDLRLDHPKVPRPHRDPRPTRTLSRPHTGDTEQ